MMNYRYDGISVETLMLMSENAFRDSKDFYERNKDKLKKGITIPIRQVIEALSDTITDIDPEIPIMPTRMVSRIRRDTRFSKNKHLYRENLWAMFMRDKHALPYYPCMWFEVSPNCYSGGVGIYDAPPALMAIFRKHLVENQSEFLKAAKSAESAGAVFHCESYKKPKSNCPSEKAAPYFNAKSFYFIYSFPDVRQLAQPDFIEDIRGIYKKMKPMYGFLLKVSEDYAQTLLNK
ncbi:MAG TPA: hypothetical protein DDY98_07740 [Ruminococcaceae bacterium]|nr:hypothetical protein [Oscillospiraceae bacterium]